MFSVYTYTEQPPSVMGKNEKGTNLRFTNPHKNELLWIQISRATVMQNQCRDVLVAPGLLRIMSSCNVKMTNGARNQ